MPNLVLVFTEGAFTFVKEWPDLPQARAFAAGVHSGALLYGAGSCAAYVLPHDLDDGSLQQEQSPAQVESALRAVRLLEETVEAKSAPIQQRLARGERCRLSSGRCSWDLCQWSAGRCPLDASNVSDPKSC